MRWQIELRGDPADCEMLRSLFEEADLRVFKEEDKWFLEAKELEDSETAVQVDGQAIEILSRLNGAVRLRNTTYRNVEVGPVHERGDDGKRTTHVVVHAATIEARGGVFPPTIVVDGEVQHVESRESKIARLASTDGDVREALELLAKQTP